MQMALVTGGNKGIGLALVSTLARAGVHVLMGARSAERARAAIGQLQKAGLNNIDFLRIDLNDIDSLTAAAATVTEQYPDLDLLVNNAGIPGNEGDSLETKVSDLRSTMEVNFFGTYALTQALVPILKRNAGRIVNITIPSAPNQYWNPIAYRTSKAAQNAMMEAMALDFRKHKLTLSTLSVHPGPTTTSLNDNMKAPGFHKPAQIASELLKVLNDGQTHNGEMVELHPELGKTKASGIMMRAAGLFASHKRPQK
ncbi:SDR family NAD(P)-dependent oxidoreductase [Lacticaseibacillus zhaodongensis]|uniref:SDR family NAD(P)-dependent oxidoreductase n=1 Tax=Lacticaseibacillus zhaodongensis TaxID=2668065 RepID=UPI0012D2BDA2|nr:SDR family NAD(P)-dependent oxidoreductase [Lacticaseibacillus zhaodongensis]